MFINRRDWTRNITNVYGEFDIIDGLSYRFNFATDLTYFELGNHTLQTFSAGICNSRTSNTLYEDTINYNKTFGQKPQA